MMKWTNKWCNEHWNDETLERLSKSIKKTKYTSQLVDDEMNNKMMKWKKKLLNQYSNDEALEGLSKSVKQKTCKISGKASIFLATSGITKDKVAPGSSKTSTSRVKIFNI